MGVGSVHTLHALRARSPDGCADARTAAKEQVSHSDCVERDGSTSRWLCYDGECVKYSWCGSALGRDALHHRAALAVGMTFCDRSFCEEIMQQRRDTKVTVARSQLPWTRRSGPLGIGTRGRSLTLAVIRSSCTCTASMGVPAITCTRGRRRATQPVIVVHVYVRHGTYVVYVALAEEPGGARPEIISPSGQKAWSVPHTRFLSKTCPPV
jgi:hypothetical protein